MKSLRHFYEMVLGLAKYIFVVDSYDGPDNPALFISTIVALVASLVFFIIDISTTGTHFIIVLLGLLVVLSFYLFIFMSCLAIVFRGQDLNKEIKDRFNE